MNAILPRAIAKSTVKSPISPVSGVARQRAKRLPAHERRGLILEEAAAFFAENGFSASTRDLADRLGVRQALLYKYFASKEALIEEVFKQVFSEDSESRSARAYGNNGAPIETKVHAFVLGMMDSGDQLRLRLSLRAMLDGHRQVGLLEPGVVASLTRPLIAELRKAEGLPDLETKELVQAESDMILMLYGAVMFARIRDQFFSAGETVDTAARSEMFVKQFLHSAGKTLRDIHASDRAQD